MKKVLLFMTNFYGYNEDIIKEIEKRNIEVTWFLDKVNLNPAQIIASKIVPTIKSRLFDEYFFDCLEKCKDNQYDQILIVFGAAYIKPKHIQLLRNYFKNTNIVYYAWDSVENFPSILALFEAADIAFTFDKKDAEKYKVNFLPLFYVDNNISDTAIKYDVSTVMTFFLEKIKNIDEIYDLLPQKDNIYIYLKLRNRFYSFKLKLTKQNVVRKYGKYFHLNALSKQRIKEITLSSKAVMDCPLENQNGLTMRTFEVLSLNRKLITTNANIKEYDFYSPQNIFVCSDKRKDINEFLDSEFDMRFALTDHYSLKKFIDCLLEN